MDRMADLQRAGTTIVVVTHNMPTLHRVCDRAIVLRQGEMAFDGGTDEAISVYHELMHREGARRNEAGVAEADALGPVPFTGGARVSCEVIDAEGRPTRQAVSGEELALRMRVEFEADTRNPVVGVAVELQGVGAVYMCHLQPADYVGDHGPGRPLDFTVHLDNPLLAGTFQVVGVVFDEGGRHELGRSASELFAITSKADARGLVDLGARFTIDGRELRPRQLRLAR
jgi:hypothetical protein